MQSQSATATTILRENNFKVKVKLPRPPTPTSHPSLSSKLKVSFIRTMSREAPNSAAGTLSSQPQPLRRSKRMRTIVFPKKTYIALDK